MSAETPCLEAKAAVSLSGETQVLRNAARACIIGNIVRFAPPLYRLHPAIGARPVEAAGKRDLVPLLEGDEPVGWRPDTEDEEDRVWQAWAAAVMTAVAALGTSRVNLETSDRLGLDALAALPGVTRRSPVAFVCEPTRDVIEAVARTNVAHLVQTVNDETYLTVVSNWSGMFLHVAEPAILAQFGVPWDTTSASG